MIDGIFLLKFDLFHIHVSRQFWHSKNQNLDKAISGKVVGTSKVVGN